MKRNLKEIQRLPECKKVSRGKQSNGVNKRVKDYFKENFLIVTLTPQPGTPKSERLAKHKCLVLVYDSTDDYQWYVSAGISREAMLCAMVDGANFIHYKGHDYLPLPIFEEVGGRAENVRQAIANNLKKLEAELLAS